MNLMKPNNHLYKVNKFVYAGENRTYLYPTYLHNEGATPPMNNAWWKQTPGSLASSFCYSLAWTCINLGLHPMSLTLGVYFINFLFQQEQVFSVLSSPCRCCFACYCGSQVCFWDAVKYFLPAMACKTSILWISNLIQATSASHKLSCRYPHLPQHRRPKTPLVIISGFSMILQCSSKPQLLYAHIH